MHTPRLPVVDWTDAPRRFKWTRPFRRKTNSGFCACAITFQTQSTKTENWSGSVWIPDWCNMKLSGLWWQHGRVHGSIGSSSGLGVEIYIQKCLLPTIFTNFRIRRTPLHISATVCRHRQGATIFKDMQSSWAEAWTLTKKEQASIIFRRIYGRKYENGEWKSRTNRELEKMSKGENTVKLIEGQRISWLGHLEGMEEYRMPKKIFTQEMEWTRRRGRSRKGWKEEVERDVQVLEVRRWRELVADRKKWKDRPKPTAG